MASCLTYSYSFQRCSSLTELMEGGGEILDALSVLADSEYLAQILEGQDGTNSSWLSNAPTYHHQGQAENVEEDVSTDGCSCHCRSPTPPSSVPSHSMEGAQHGCTAPHHNSCASLYMDKPLQRPTSSSSSSQHSQIPYLTNHSVNAYQNHQHNSCSHSQQVRSRNNNGLPALQLLQPPEPSSPSWLDPVASTAGCGGLQGLEGDPGFYRADVAYYPASGSESSGDNCSPGYDTTTFGSLDYVLTNMDTKTSNDTSSTNKHIPVCSNNSSASMHSVSTISQNVTTNLKDLTNTIMQVKPENVPTTVSSCAFSFPPSASPSSTLGGEILKPCTGGGLSSSSSCTSSRVAPTTTTPYQSENIGVAPGVYDAALMQQIDSMSQTSYLSDEGSETSVSNTTTGKPDRRLRRREQNRQAARRCRQRKKAQSQELVKEYYQLLSANSEMQSKLKVLETEKQRLKDIYDAHLATCNMHTSQC